MFTKKSHLDVKKSTLKIQDSRKDSVTRLKHLKIVLEHVDLEEAKSIFETNFSHVYYILYDSFVQAESNLRQRVHKAHREDLEGALWLLNKVLCLLPELVSRRWQIHSLGRLLSKLLHPANNHKLRSEGVRLFLLWYQALADSAPPNVHSMFANLVPGLGTSTVGGGDFRNFKGPSEVEFSPTDLLQHPNFSSTKDLGSAVFHDTVTTPVQCLETLPLLPPSGHDRSSIPETRVLLETLLDGMVSTTTCLIWRERAHTRHVRGFSFLLEKFREVYLPLICPDFDNDSSLYNPKLDLPELRYMNPLDEMLAPCRVVLIKWIASFTHETKKVPEKTSNAIQPHSFHADEEVTTDSSLTTITSQTSQEVIGGIVVKEVLYGSRENVNLIHEMYRQAFLLGFAHSAAIRKTIAVYKDWIQMTVPDPPPFLLEPMDSSENNAQAGQVETPRGGRLRNDSYLGAILKENLLIRAGLQNMLQVFVTQAANVFLLVIPVGQCHLLEEQTDTCKRVLNIYRYMVMHAHMEARTWEQLLVVLLQVTSLVLNKVPPKRKNDTLGGTLAQAIFQTLIVTWIKANLNVGVSPELWERFLTVLSSLTQWEELIKEWAKTMETLTRVLARHVYSLDLADLPLDRLAEQKGKRQRRVTSARLGSPIYDGNSELNTPSIVKTEGPIQDIDMENGSLSVRRNIRGSNMCRCHSEGSLALRKGKVRSRSQNLHVPVLPTSVESSLTRLLAMSPSRVPPFNKARLVGMRRAVSLDSVRPSIVSLGDTLDSEVGTRSPSPTPSSGLEGSSIKDTPMQIDVLGGDSSSIDVSDSEGLERRSVLSGGCARGWLPDVAAMLWARMLGALGDINAIENPALHAKVFEYLVHLTETLIKIKHNQGVANDKQHHGPMLLDLVPPIGIVAPWCYRALGLDPAYREGRINALRLLCTIARYGGPVPHNHLPMFFAALHNSLSGEDRGMGSTALKHLGGSRFLSLLLPGHTLLLLDLVHAATVVLTSSDTGSNTPRFEAACLLSSMLCLPQSALPGPVLQPASPHITLMECPDMQEHVLNVVLRCARHEPSARARCAAFSALGQYVYQQLQKLNPSPRLVEVVQVLLQALKFQHKVVARIAAESLRLSCERPSLCKQFPLLPARIIRALQEALAALAPTSQRPPNDQDKVLITSLLFCLGEFCMALPQSYLMNVHQGGHEPLLLSVYNILHALSLGSQPTRMRAPTLPEDDDFEYSISADDLSDNPPTPSSARSPHCAQTVKMCAKTVSMHLINHLGHFPMGVGASSISSLVEEQDDLLLGPSSGQAKEDLSAQVLSSPNLQLFLLRAGLVASLVELPALKLPGGGPTAGLVTAQKQVRVLLRDLSGKSSWDASILYCEPESLPTVPAMFDQSQSMAPPSIMMSTVGFPGMISGSPLRHTLRHRPQGQLPLVENAAPDLDQLDDLLQYVGYTSPECLNSQGDCLNAPALSPLTHGLETQIISAVLGQRGAENDYLHRAQGHSSMVGPSVSPPPQLSSYVPFQHCRLLYSQLGFAGWARRAQLHLLGRSDKLLRELRNLDTQRCRETHKMAVIYVGCGQDDKTAILKNGCGSHSYEMFVSALGWEVELESHTGFLGGLQRQGSTGLTAPYYATSFLEVIFHVATRMPCDNPEDMLSKTRHLGNDEVHIVWSENNRDYRRDILPTEFCDVLITIYPLQSGLFRVTVNRKSDVPYFGPLCDEAVVGGSCLAGLVRATAINASRAKRTGLPFYQQYYEERARSLDTVATQHRESSTFEEFASKVFCPAPSQVIAAPSGSTGSNLAAALLDKPSKGWIQHAEFTASAREVAQQTAEAHQISPRPLKRIGHPFKAAPRRLTGPPESPTLPSRRYR